MFKSYFCDRTYLGQLWSDHIFVIVHAKGLITLLLYCSKGKWRILLCKQISTHNLRIQFILLAYDVTVFVYSFCNTLIWKGCLLWSTGVLLECGARGCFFRVSYSWMFFFLLFCVFLLFLYLIFLSFPSPRPANFVSALFPSCLCLCSLYFWLPGFDSWIMRLLTLICGFPPWFFFSVYDPVLDCYYEFSCRSIKSFFLFTSGLRLDLFPTPSPTPHNLLW